MAWKGVFISRPSRLSTRDGQMVVVQDDGEVTLPLEDVAYVVVDTPQATMSSALVAAGMDSGMALIFTDSRHMPSGLTLPFHRHHRQAAVAAMQIGLSAPFRKRCWQAIVTGKINNQASHLILAERPNADAVRAMAEWVGSGDPDNVEARAARQYWGALFDDFIRDDESDLRNALLNYGYAVMRAAIARALTAYGLLPAFGLHHCGSTNAFNLADDMIEPFRPFVDVLARARAESRSKGEAMTIDDRRAMAGVLMGDCTWDDGVTTLLTATELGAESLIRAMESGSPALLRLPRLGPKR